MKNSIFYLLLFLSTSVYVGAQDFKKDKLDSLLTILETNNKFMGSVSVAKDGNVIYSRAVGFQDVEANKKATLNTRYRVGSISKMFTSVLLFKSIESGKISLETKLSSFYPSIPNAEHITIAHMMGHKSGIFSVTSRKDFQSWKDNPKSKEEMLAMTADSEPLFEPGSKSQYSNSNYILLSYILEEIHKKPYAKLVEEKISKPLKLKDTYVSTGIDPDKQEGYSYARIANWKMQSATDPSITMGAGSIVSTPAELIKFNEAIFQGKMIKKSSLDKMVEIVDDLGLGIMKFSFNGKESLGHSGSIDGFNAFVAYQPEDKISISMTSNGINLNNNQMVQHLFNTVYDHHASLPYFSDIKFSSAELEEFSGTYSAEGIPFQIVVHHENGVLLAQATGQEAFPLEAESKSTFKFDGAGIQISFDTIADFLLLKQRGKEMKFKKE